MDIRPILSTLRRHKIAAALIVMEIALSCAILCNALFLVKSRMDRASMPSGIAEAEVAHLIVTGIGEDTNATALTHEDLAALRAIPGVRAADVSNQIPFGNSSWNSGLRLGPDKESTVNSGVYFGGETLLDAFGVKVTAGRDFLPDEFVDDSGNGKDRPKPRSAIVTRATAERLFPGQNPLGKQFWFGENDALTVVGVVDRLVRPSFWNGDATADVSIITPVRAPYTVTGYYVLRTDPARRAAILKAAQDVLLRNGPNRIVLESRTFDDVRARFFQQDRSMIWLLTGVCIALLVVTALGIVGLASFWVQQRTKQIGVRRALGATRGQVLRYFQTENFLLATLGIVIGMVLAYGLNQVLMHRYELPRLPAFYLPAGAVALWLLGQLAVLGPARRAAAVPPALATRSV